MEQMLPERNKTEMLYIHTEDFMFDEEFILMTGMKKKMNDDAGFSNWETEQTYDHAFGKC